MGEGCVFDSLFSILRETQDTKTHSLELPLPLSFLSTVVCGLDPVSSGSVCGLLRVLGAVRVTNCPHYRRKHYAKGMCSACYHKSGRTVLAQVCRHKDRPLYAKGRCQYCYLRRYSRINRKTALFYRH